jgi:hypothetical protein
VDFERQDKLLTLENKRERLLEKEAERNQKVSPKSQGKISKGADEKMAEKLLWIYIDIAFNKSMLVNIS